MEAYDLEAQRLSSRFKEIRKELGLTQLDISRRTGIMESTIGGFENGTRTPHLKSLIALFDAIGCEIDIKKKGDH